MTTIFKAMAVFSIAMASTATSRAAAPAAIDALLKRGNDLLAAKDFAAARAEYAKLADDESALPALRSIAQLRIAQSLRRQKNLVAAEAAYDRISRIQGAPPHHIEEAREQIREMQRLQAGQPVRDNPSARTALPAWPTPGAVLHVAADGSDGNAGAESSPFATLERARDEIRAMKKRGNLPAGGVTVVIHGGRYAVSKSFALTAEDSGTEASPIVYCAAKGESPVFSGGATVTGFKTLESAIVERLPAEARGKVMQADLRPCGVAAVPPVRLGGFASGAGFASHPGVELFCDGKALPLARWPNQGFTKVIEVRGKTPQKGHGPSGFQEGVFTYEGDRPQRWAADPDILLYGYWFYGWADSYERVESIDTRQRLITLAKPFHRYGYRNGQPFTAVNLLSEIDEPGEWYLDRTNLVLYVYPPTDLDKAKVELSVTAVPFATLHDVSYTAFQGLTWELGCVDAILVQGGDHCRLTGCTVRRFAGNGVEIRGGTSHAVLSCDIYSLGRGGILLTGGDRKTLNPGRHAVANCHIYELSRLDHTYTPAVLLSGAGNTIRHNLFHDIGSSAIRLNGNDQLVEFNEVCRVVLESDDQGGTDMFGNPTFRGNVFRYNYWHHIGNWSNPAQSPDCGQAGIRLDDAISGVLVYGNVFRRCATGKLGFGGVQIHGGQNNVLDNNLFVDCATAVSFSPWPELRWKELTGKALDSPEIDRALYLQRYPNLAQMNDDINVNYLLRNLVVGCDSFLRRDRGGARLIDNRVERDRNRLPGADRGFLAVDPESPLLDNASFQPIPFQEIGLHGDMFRRELPRELIDSMRAGR